MRQTIESKLEISSKVLKALVHVLQKNGTRIGLVIHWNRYHQLVQ